MIDAAPLQPVLSTNRTQVTLQAQDSVGGGMSDSRVESVNNSNAVGVSGKPEKVLQVPGSYVAAPSGESLLHVWQPTFAVVGGLIVFALWQCSQRKKLLFRRRGVDTVRRRSVL